MRREAMKGNVLRAIDEKDLKIKRLL